LDARAAKSSGSNRGRRSDRYGNDDDDDHSRHHDSAHSNPGAVNLALKF
jgi:hypothetical protein